MVSKYLKNKTNSNSNKKTLHIVLEDLTALLQLLLMLLLKFEGWFNHIFAILRKPQTLHLPVDIDLKEDNKAAKFKKNLV